MHIPHHPSPRRSENWTLDETLAASAEAPSKSTGQASSLSCGALVGATLTERHAWHPPATQQDAAIKRMKTLIYRLRSRGDEYNADIAELELLPYISGPNEKLSDSRRE